MRRLLCWWLLATLLFAAVPVAVVAQDVQAVITSPRPNAVVRGSVSVQGVASHPDFWKYEVWVAPGLNPRDDAWSVILIREQPLPGGGQLALWHTNAFPDGVYSLRLRVVRSDANYEEVVVGPINVANTVPPTPVPEPPTPPPTPEPPTPTPEPPTPTPGPLFSPTPEPLFSPTPPPTLAPTGPLAPLVADAIPPTTGGLLPTLTPLPAAAVMELVASPTVVTIEQPPVIATPTELPALVAQVNSGEPPDQELPDEVNLNLGVDSNQLASACFVGMASTLMIFLALGLLALARQVVRWMV